MGFFGFLLGVDRELKAMREEIAAEIAAAMQDIQQKHDTLKKENEQILEVLALFEREIAYLKEDAGTGKKAGKFEATIERRMQRVEKIGNELKTIGRLSVQNYDAVKSIEPSLKKLDSFEKALKEHISLTPEVIISKDEYSEEISELKSRLDALERKEIIIVKQEKKREKKQ